GKNPTASVKSILGSVASSSFAVNTVGRPSGVLTLFRSLAEGEGVSDMQTLYLDHNATTPLRPEVLEAMLPYLQTHFGNPSSVHWGGRRAKQGVENAREQVATLLHCRPAEVLFTSGGTESNNLALCGVLRAMRERGRHVITTAIEHSSILEPLRVM